jgi:hypothetical protein
MLFFFINLAWSKQVHTISHDICRKKKDFTFICKIKKFHWFSSFIFMLNSFCKNATRFQSCVTDQQRLINLFAFMANCFIFFSLSSWSLANLVLNYRYYEKENCCNFAIDRFIFFSLNDFSCPFGSSVK